MKIAFLIRSLNCGGAERQLVLLAKGLHAAGHRVSVLVFYPAGRYESELRLAGIDVNVIGKFGRWDLISFFRNTCKALKRENAEIVHAYLGSANIVVALLKSFLRPAKIVWGVRASALNYRDYDWLYWVSWRIERILARFADLVISNSEAGRRNATNAGFPAARIAVVSNGVDLRTFVIDQSARERLRRQWGIAENDVLIGRIGRLDPMKDYPVFLQAAALLSQKDPRLKFICIGTGPADYLCELHRYAKEVGIEHRVIWTGLIEQMSDAYNALDLLVSSSKCGEGFPNILIEAMACGLPCVATDVGDAKEVVADAGIIVPPSEPRLLADACLTLVQRTSERNRIRKTIADRYSSDALVKRTEHQLRSLLGEAEADAFEPLKASLGHRRGKVQD